MKVIIATKNFNASDELKERIEKKFQKLDKYFSKELVANIMLSNEKGKRQKLEATINTGGMIFRAEEMNQDIYYCLDKVVDRLVTQTSRFKEKIVKRHRGQKDIFFSSLPDVPEKEETITPARIKRFLIHPMGTEEAILQMELLGHSFFIFLDENAENVNVVYKRGDGSYGLLITRK